MNDPTSAKLGSLGLPLALLGLGFVARLGEAVCRFLNADEALHYLLSVQPSLAATYRATLTTAHPPLLIVFLHYWGMLGHSEVFLRMPSLIAGTGFCWVMFCWLRRVTDYGTALTALFLLLFSPALLVLSAEVRQYPLLLLFVASGLYFLDRAIEEDSIGMTLPSCAALYLALLTHYSALIFALTLGVYALVRFAAVRPRAGIVLVWAAAQVGALALIASMLIHHVSRLKASGLTEVIADTYLHRSFSGTGFGQYLVFIVRSNIRLFHYWFSQEAVGALGLVLFVCGVVFLIRDHRPRADRLPSHRQLAFLLVFPLAVNCILALARLYPYGGSRHNSYLAIFVLPGIAVALARWRPWRVWWGALAVVAVMVACNLFPSPEGEYIAAKDQNRRLMTEATADLSALPTDSIIFTDDQGGLLLSYYLCHSRVSQIEQQPFQPFLRSDCGHLTVISLNPDLWIFKAETFPDTLRRAQQMYNLHSGSEIWLFQAGWFVDKELALRDELKRYGCVAPQTFGRNMLMCRLKLE